MLNKKRLCFTALVTLLCVTLTRAQTTLVGVVVDANTKEALIGANVILKGTSTGTTTDWDGSFELKVDALPVTIEFSYLGYVAMEQEITDASKKIDIALEEDGILIETVEVKGSRILDKQKESPLTVESLDLLAIKETPASSFYEGLGALKGVDLTTASLGFTIINTRGFNSTSPVRSLQIIDGVDNQSPGLNFSLGNFLGSSDLDVLKVDLVVGASSAFFGPNAFNGVIDMRTKNPFLQKGLSVEVRGGERNLLKTAVRYADAFKNKKGEDVFAFKLNLMYFSADDWEATNFNPTDQSNKGINNPGGYDAVNIYGDENLNNGRNFDLPDQTAFANFPGLGEFYRRGYEEVDLVDYDTENIKANVAAHYKITQDIELIGSFSYGSGTTVYQGDNRFSLKDIKFYQSRIELMQPNKFFIRAYRTSEDAGNSYDAYFTGLLLQEEFKSNDQWSSDYIQLWQTRQTRKVRNLEGFPTEFPINFPQLITVINNNQDSLTRWHNQTQEATNGPTIFNPNTFLEPGTPEFQAAFDRITSSLPTDEQRGTRFFDRSALFHVHGEYKFTPKFMDITVGANYRKYSPDSKGTIFSDTSGVKITNSEYGVYAGIEKKLLDQKLKFNATLRMDKNENFDYLFSPAASVVYSPDKKNIFRFSFSSAIRNPTLSDQYLLFDVGRATLLGNLNGVNDVVTIESIGAFARSQNPDSLVYFNEPGIRPENVKSFEVGYRTTLGSNFWIDASYYYSFYDNFIGFKLGADIEFDQGTNLLRNVDVFRIAANAASRVTTQGFSIGGNYYFPKYLVLGANYSWNVLNKKGADDPIIPAFNTPEHKFNINVSGRDMELKLGGLRIPHFGFNINYKWVEGFLFEGSPQFTGFINSYDLVDAQMNVRFEKINTTVKLGASNVLDNRQIQTYGGPAIGRMAYISVLYEWNKK